jgi:hypothetical protein
MLSYDQEFFHPSKHRVSQKWSLPSFTKYTKLFNIPTDKHVASNPKSTNLMLSSQEDNSDSSRLRMLEWVS